MNLGQQSIILATSTAQFIMIMVVLGGFIRPFLQVSHAYLQLNLFQTVLCHL